MGIAHAHRAPKLPIAFYLGARARQSLDRLAPGKAWTFAHLGFLWPFPAEPAGGAYRRWGSFFTKYAARANLFPPAG